MYATAKTQGGLHLPLKLNDFEFERRVEQRKKEMRKQRALEKLNDTDTRRGLYALRNYGIDKVIEMDRQARAEQHARELQEAHRIADLMTKEAIMALQKGLI